MTINNRNKHRPAESGRKNQKILTGFTLIELVVYSGLVVILISAIVFFAIWAIQAAAKVKLSYALTNNARRAMEVMTYEIKKSRSIYGPASSFGTSRGQISLEQTATSTAKETTVFLDFFQCGNSLCEKREGEAPVALTNDQIKITNLMFTQLLNSSSTPSVQINLRLEPASVSAQPAGNDSLELISTATLRPF